MVDDPKDYRWCGYAEAVAGDRLARRGLVGAMRLEESDADWRHVGAAYRKVLFGMGEESESRAGISRAEVAKVWESGGKLTLAQLLRCRVRYFSDGVAIGSEGFVEGFFKGQRGMFSVGRKTGSRRLKGGGWGELRVIRDLGVTPVVPPTDSG